MCNRVDCKCIVCGGYQSVAVGHDNGVEASCWWPLVLDSVRWILYHHWWLDYQSTILKELRFLKLTLY